MGFFRAALSISLISGMTCTKCSYPYGKARPYFFTWWMSLGLVKVNCNNFFTIITLKIVDFYLPKFYPKTVPQCVTANYIALILLDGKGQSKWLPRYSLNKHRVVTVVSLNFFFAFIVSIEINFVPFCNIFGWILKSKRVLDRISFKWVS
jgi:hypothetical protein